ncbi:MAG: glycosyltransferase [Cohaesibacter sp.]|jgi:glycosyltransferase involved in cell wall biosynthesis|nr:glycosyltransferase [Cohaesibacter sp.]
MHILHICPSFVHPDRRLSGVSKAAFDLAEAMAKQGHQVDFVAPLVELKKSYAMPKAGFETIGGRLRLHYCTDARYSRFGTTTGNLGAIMAPLLVRCDIVHVHAFLSPWTHKACQLAKAARKAYVIQPHGKLSAGMLANRARMKKAYLRLFGQSLLRQASAVSVLAQPIADFVRDWDPKIPVWVCPNGLDPKSFQGEMVLKRPIEEPYLLYLGMLDPRKRLDILIDAFALLKQSPDLSPDFQSVKLALVGGDDYAFKKELELRIQQLGLSDEIVMPGHVAGDDKFRWLSHAEAFCLSSDGEGLSIAMIEALASGLPCLLSKGCNASIVAEQEAGLVLDSTPKEWEKAMRQAISDPILKAHRSKNAIRLFEENYTLQSVAERMLGKYEAILQ